MHPKRRCDGKADCKSYIDEQDCDLYINPRADSFLCNDNKGFILQRKGANGDYIDQLGDGLVQCSDGSDELHCKGMSMLKILLLKADFS